MRALVLKEIASFFATITGYAVLVVFLALTSLFLWLFPGEFNLLDSGYAQLDGLFMLAPWVFLFLIPALTMRMLADERRMGTLELLLTKPLTDGQIIVGKFLAGLVLVALALLPTLIYAVTVYQLGNPTGNMDLGSVAGSYVGLFFLASAYLSIGLFASSLTDNTIVAFIGGMLGSFLLFDGLERMADLSIFQGIQLFILQLGMNEHYLSLSRGVLDSRDIFYFAGISALFLGAARWVLMRRGNSNKPARDWAVLAAVVLAVNVASQWGHFRWDLTAEKRYSLGKSTLALLEQVEEPLLFTVYLEGDLPTGFQRLKRETLQMLNEFRAENRLVQFRLVDPSESEDERDRAEVYQQLRTKGLGAVQVEIKEKNGVRNVELFPGAVASYGDKETVVLLLTEQFAVAPEAQINASVQNLEYALANSLRQLVLQDRPRVALLEGHGELPRPKSASLEYELSKNYAVERFNLREFVVDSTTQQLSLVQQQLRLNTFQLVVINKPTQPFSDLDKWLLDQYVMSGGKVIWAVDAVHAEIDSLSRAPEFLAYPQWDALRLSDQLFGYGVRVNTSLVQDLVAGGVNDRRAVHRWVYFPLLMAQTKHPISKDLNAVRVEFGTSLDTVAVPGVKKTVLLQSSPYAKRQATPSVVSLRTLYEEPAEVTFQDRLLPMAVLLEGKFPSVFKNRIAPKNEAGKLIPLLSESKPTQMVVVADGDLAKNQLNVVNPNLARGIPLPMGYDQYTDMQYGNANFVLNTVDYLLDSQGLIGVRSREVKLRLLDAQRVTREGSFWKTLNTVLPLALVALGGFLFRLNRKRRYSTPQ
ncbi:MAG: gliding motility-associated ABC transporter substrate-binding protein GldG [Schleiferiaceae bacterium]|jgi:ABC-2 type transport system permease protein|nr:gliding motility-associated ABC transporter substrate-binding protein GldG [Schleiferiaceae bacterium]MDP4627092.1 gliding motility-associated ABC transporter substrate-binding protein GldG [Schleiferiaceae bacterium]MDP4727879.1 gliding motility-associated ABC transporter substrate-binding protein GldG [Schleiferiaceae bacterium]MDP4749307.1 gliding motility-associated ABC transporter substrate-binding protein GldG [Schleiferiaceae bacterium]MDP4858717.1 gliding motility-associated ABC tran